MTTEHEHTESGQSPGMLEHALAYAAEGHPVFPLGVGSKMPLISKANGGRGHLDATTDEEQIRLWWGNTASANIGIRTGVTFDVMDIDPEKDGHKSAARISGEMGINLKEISQRTPVSKTRSGGFHMCFAVDPTVRSGSNVFDVDRSNPKYPGLDIRAQGGYIVAAPSIVDGKTYKWITPLATPLQPWPPEILERLANRKAEREIDWEQIVSQGVGEGARDDMATRIAGHYIAVGMSATEVTAILHTFAENCRPPWGEMDKWVSLVERLWNAEQAKPKPKYHLTDTGNAERFRDQHRHHVRYCPQMREHGWFVYDGKRWVRDNGLLVDQMMKETLFSMYAESEGLEPNDAMATRKWAATCEAQGKRDAALKLARSEMVVLATEFDRDKWILNCQNGTLDLRDGTLRPHRPEDLCTKITRATYRPEAQDPIWDNFLEEKIPDIPLRLWVQKIAGYILTGERTGDFMLNLYGTTRTGKTTFCEALRSTLGDYATSASADTFMVSRRDNGGAANRPDLARLFGMRLVVSAEAEEHQRLDEALVKSITGCDPIVASAKYENPIEFKPEFLWVLYGNHQARVRDDEEAIWRRIRVVPFEVTVSQDDEDPSIREHVIQAHDAVLAWAVDGLIAYLGEGLFPLPNQVKMATGKYRSKMNALSEFIAECCVLDEMGQKKAALSSLRTRYEGYCDAQRIPARGRLTTREMEERLIELGCVKKRGTAGVWYWYGIEIRPRER